MDELVKFNLLFILNSHKNDKNNEALVEELLAKIRKAEQTAYEKGFQCGREAGKAEQKQVESMSRKWYIG